MIPYENAIINGNNFNRLTTVNSYGPTGYCVYRIADVVLDDFGVRARFKLFSDRSDKPYISYGTWAWSEISKLDFVE